MKFLEVINLKKYFPINVGFFKSSKKFIKAVDGVSFSLIPGEVIGLVGESGSGKTTLANLIVGLLKQDSGKILLEGEDIFSPVNFKLRKSIQIIFQNPFSSLNPYHRVEKIIGEAIINRAKFNSEKLNRKQILEEVKYFLNLVGLPSNSFRDYPHQFSGGQRQRIGIARALAMKPKLIVADEPVSSLDISIQAQILNLLIKLKEEFGLSYIFITHDLNVVRFLADYILVMNQGKIVEEGKPEKIFSSPVNSYTQKLLEAIPHPFLGEEKNLWI